MDVLMLKGDADPRTRAIMTGILTLDETPEWARLINAFEDASRAVPRMRQRVIGPVLPGMAPEWCVDPEFDVGYHVRRVGVPRGGGLSDVLELAASLSTAPLDAARPLWDATLVDSLAEDGAVLIFRAHHALTDGLGAVAVLASLLDLERGHYEPTDVTGEHGAPRSPGVGKPRRVRLQQASTTQLRAATRRTAHFVEAGARLVRDPKGTVEASINMGGSLRRLVTRPVAEPSVLFRERSRRRVFRTLEVSLEQLRASSKASGCTVNDAYIAGLLGGFRRYHAAMGVETADVPLALPMSTRSEGNTAAGNHLSMARLAGPASIDDPAERMKVTHELIAGLRAEPALCLIDAVADVLQHVPSALAIRGLTAHAQQVDLHASNLAGAPFAVYLAGARVRRMFPFGPLSGVPVMTVLLSYDGTCGIGLTLDPAAITDPDLFVQCVSQSFDEITGIARSAVHGAPKEPLFPSSLSMVNGAMAASSRGRSNGVALLPGASGR